MNPKPWSILQVKYPSIFRGERDIRPEQMMKIIGKGQYRGSKGDPGKYQEEIPTLGVFDFGVTNAEQQPEDCY